MQLELNRALETGAVLFITGGMQAVFRASNLSALSLHLYSVMPTRLTGLLTLSEQSYFQAAASRKDLRIVPLQHPLVQPDVFAPIRNQSRQMARKTWPPVGHREIGTEIDEGNAGLFPECQMILPKVARFFFTIPALDRIAGLRERSDPSA